MVKDKKKAVLKSAEYLFATQGFEKTTVADIAKTCGINEASIYSCFSSKRNILFAIYGTYLQRATITLQEHFLGMKEPGPKLRKAIWHYLSDMQNYQHYAKINMMAQRENQLFYASKYFRYLKDYSKLIMGVVVNGQKEHFFRSDINPRLIINMAMGTSIFTAYDSIIRGYSLDPHEYSDVIYSLVVNATGADNNIDAPRKASECIKTAELRRSQILETATHIFAAKGFSNATISDIARQANLGDATLYEYFDNKEAILLGIPEMYLENLTSSEDMRLLDLPETEKKLKKLIWQWIWMLYSNDDFARVLVIELMRNINFYSSPAYQYIDSFKKDIEKVVEQGQQEGLFIEKVPFPAYFHLIVGTIDQYLLSHFLAKQSMLTLSGLGQIVDAMSRSIRLI